MSKKKLNEEAIMNELNGSVFFPSRQEEEKNEEMKKSSNEEMKNAGNEDLKISSNEESKKSSFEELKNPPKRATYQKANYRLCPEALEAIALIKSALRRKYNIKATAEDIVELIVLREYEDFINNGEASKIVAELKTKK